MIELRVFYHLNTIQIWIFSMKKVLILLSSTILCSCSLLSSSNESKGQVIYHWERENTSVEKFARDHSECMNNAEAFRFVPNIKSWFYSEEARLDIRANWHSERGVWASYVAFPGTQPIIVNSLRMNEAINPRKYRLCMEDRGYWHRSYNIPTTTNIYTYNPQKKTKDLPFEYAEF